MITTATATEVQNNFGRYLAYVLKGNQVIVKKNGKEVARLLPHDATVSFLTDSLTGILQGDYNLKEAKEERLERKYAIAD